MDIIVTCLFESLFIRVEYSATVICYRVFTRSSKRPANFQHCGCWKFAGRLLDRVNTPLDSDRIAVDRYALHHNFGHCPALATYLFACLLTASARPLKHSMRAIRVKYICWLLTTRAAAGTRVPVGYPGNKLPG